MKKPSSRTTFCLARRRRTVVPTGPPFVAGQQDDGVGGSGRVLLEFLDDSLAAARLFVQDDNIIFVACLRKTVTWDLRSLL